MRKGPVRATAMVNLHVGLHCGVCTPITLICNCSANLKRQSSFLTVVFFFRESEGQDLKVTKENFVIAPEYLFLHFRYAISNRSPFTLCSVLLIYIKNCARSWACWHMAIIPHWGGTGKVTLNYTVSFENILYVSSKQT